MSDRSKQRARAGVGGAPDPAAANPTLARILNLDWGDLVAVFGSRTVGRGERYQERGAVADLRWTRDHRLLARVRGGDVYETAVGLGAAGEVATSCSCPVGDTCKHGVATILELLEVAARGEVVPIVDGATEPRTPVDPPAAAVPSREQLATWLTSLPVEALAEHLLDAAARSEVVHRDLIAAFHFANGGDDESVAAVRGEIEALTAEDVEYDGWRKRGELPDYAGLRSRFEQLADDGLDDALLDLGLHLFELGEAQVDQAHDHGETAWEIRDCLELAFRSLRKASGPLETRVLLALELVRRDQYGLVPESVREFATGRHRKVVWAAVADALLAGLGPAGDPSTFAARVGRSEYVDQLVLALDRCGRQAEATAVLRDEAAVTRNFVRLVDRFAAAQDLEAAKAAAHDGLAVLGSEDVAERRGLRERLRGFAEAQDDGRLAAAYRADAFFRAPSVAALEQLLEATRGLAEAATVRRWAERYLATGRCPVAGGFVRNNGEPAAWPLPATGDDVAPQWSLHLGLRVLRDLAIREEKPHEVLRWHDRLRKEVAGGSVWSLPRDTEPSVARAIEASHPDRAIEIYRAVVAEAIGRKTVDGYGRAAGMLDRIRGILGAERHGEWLRMIEDLRYEHRRKSNLMRELDRLVRSPLEAAGNRRRRDSR